MTAMKLHPIPFLDPDPDFTIFKDAAVAIIPFPFEGNISYESGTALAPEAILKASHYVEFYDEMLEQEPYKMGIATIAMPEIPSQAEEMLKLLRATVSDVLQQGKFPVVLGGDHSISSACCQACSDHFGEIAVIQFDAHADLRDTYEESKWSHASVMARIREITPHTLQLGIRSLCAEEAKTVKENSLYFFTMHELLANSFAIDKALDQLPQNVFITLDVDVFDTGLIQHTGTPEPGGIGWYDALALLQKIFTQKNCV